MHARCVLCHKYSINVSKYFSVLQHLQKFSELNIREVISEVKISLKGTKSPVILVALRNYTPR